MFKNPLHNKKESIENIDDNYNDNNEENNEKNSQERLTLKGRESTLLSKS